MADNAAYNVPNTMTGSNGTSVTGPMTIAVAEALASKPGNEPLKALIDDLKQKNTFTPDSLVLLQEALNQAGERGNQTLHVGKVEGNTFVVDGSVDVAHPNDPVKSMGKITPRALGLVVDQANPDASPLPGRPEIDRFLESQDMKFVALKDGHSVSRNMTVQEFTDSDFFAALPNDQQALFKAKLVTVAKNPDNVRVIVRQGEEGAVALMGNTVNWPKSVTYTDSFNLKTGKITSYGRDGAIALPIQDITVPHLEQFSEEVGKRLQDRSISLDTTTALPDEALAVVAPSTPSLKAGGIKLA